MAASTMKFFLIKQGRTLTMIGAATVATTISMAGIVLWAMLETEWPALVHHNMEARVTFVDHTGKDGFITLIRMNMREKFTELFVFQGVIVVPVSTRSPSK